MGNHYLQDALVTLEAEHAAAKARSIRQLDKGELAG